MLCREIRNSNRITFREHTTQTIQQLFEFLNECLYLLTGLPILPSTSSFMYMLIEVDFFRPQNILIPHIPKLLAFHLYSSRPGQFSEVTEVISVYGEGSVQIRL